MRPAFTLATPLVLAMIRSATGFTVSVSVEVQVLVPALKLLVMPPPVTQLKPLLSVPAGVWMLAALATLPVLAVTVVVTVIW